jgi:hypothetical protein
MWVGFAWLGKGITVAGCCEDGDEHSDSIRGVNVLELLDC